MPTPEEMTPESGAGNGGQVPPVQTPETPGQVPASQAPTTDTQTQNQETFDQERARALIEKLRPFEKLAEKAEKRAAEAEKRLKEFEDAKLSEQERKDKRLAELEEAVKSAAAEKAALLRDSALERAARAADVKEGKYLDLVMQQLRTADLETGEDGRPTSQSIEASLSALRTDYPDLFKPKPGSAGTPPTPGGQPTNPAKGRPLTLEAVQAMTDPDEINARWEEIQQVLRRHSQ